MKILLSNLAYARGINGSLGHHMAHMYRHFFCPIFIQKKALAKFKNLVESYNPDLCCLIEIDGGSINSFYFNQIKYLLDYKFRYHDIDSKYQEKSSLHRFPFTRGKCNGFIAKQELPFTKLYFSHGTKRLIYRINLSDNLTLFFTHFSLMQDVRKKQFIEIKKLISEVPGEVIILGDFNILTGFAELSLLLEGTNLKVMNEEKNTTFTFHKKKLALDLCICSESIVDSVQLDIIPQQFSDHDALLVEISEGGSHF